MDDNELLRTLARASGYRCEPGAWSAIKGFIISASDGEPVGFGVTEVGAWNNAEDHMPDWRYNSVVALKKLPWPWDDIADFSIELSRTHAAVRMIMKPNNGEEYTGGGALLAAALCDVFAAWFEEHEKEAPHA